MPDPTFTTAPDAPSRAEPATFSTKADAFLSWMQTFQGELSTGVSWFSSTTSTVATNAGIASDAATSASASATLASAASGATLHVPNASYDAGDAAISNVDFAAYRCILTHTGVATDPSADATNWTAAIPSANVGLVPISRAVASNDVSVEFTGLSSTYDVYVLEIISAKHASGSFDNLLMVTSSDGGTTYDTGASDYYDSTARAFIFLAGQVNTSGLPGINGSFTIHAASDATDNTYVLGLAAWAQAGTATSGRSTPSRRASNGVVDAIKIYYQNGNVLSGQFNLYGRVKP